MSVNLWVDKDNVCTRNGVLPCLEKGGDSVIYDSRGNFEDVMLSETSQSQRDKHCMSPLTGGSESSQSQTPSVGGYRVAGVWGRRRSGISNPWA